MTLCHKEAQLLKRNEKLEELWCTDEQLREWHATSAWSRGQIPSSDVSSLTAHRQQIVTDLKSMGAVTWEFRPTKDNSWLAVQRQRIV